MSKTARLFLLLISMILASGVGYAATPENCSTLDFGTAEIYVFDIGKADAILIITKNHAVMIDTGEDRYGSMIVDYLSDRDISEIDYLIITHFHKDHVGGANMLIRNLAVKEIIVPDYGKDSKQYNQFIQAADDAGIERKVLQSVLKFTLDDAEFTVFPPWQEYYDFGSAYNEDDSEGDTEDENEDIPKENNFSIVVAVRHGSNNFLFSGDAKSKRLRELLSLEEITGTQFNLLKVPHHGRYAKRSRDFIYSIMPEYAVVTCSEEEPADIDVLEMLEAAGTQVYLTSNGSVSCKSDGYNLSMEYIK